MNTDTPSNTQHTPKRRRNTANRPLRINWRHRQFVTLYVTRGLTDAPRCVIEVGLAHDIADAEVSARNYLRRAEIVELIREEIRGAGLTEAKVRENVTKWMDSEDPNASLRASDLGARILGMLREPAPAVPQLPPLIVVQAALPQLDSDQTALEASYTVVDSDQPFISVEQTVEREMPDRAPKAQPKARKPVKRTGTRKAGRKAAEGTQEAKT